MPLYEFRCPDGHDFEKFYRSIGAAPSQENCPECGLVAARLMSAAGLVFKGSGFYITDYGKDGKKAERDAATAATAATAKADAKSESKTESQAESKPGEAGTSKSTESAPAAPAPKATTEAKAPSTPKPAPAAAAPSKKE